MRNPNGIKYINFIRSHSIESPIRILLLTTLFRRPTVKIITFASKSVCVKYHRRTSTPFSTSHSTNAAVSVKYKCVFIRLPMRDKRQITIRSVCNRYSHIIFAREIASAPTRKSISCTSGCIQREFTCFNGIFGYIFGFASI